MGRGGRGCSSGLAAANGFFFIENRVQENRRRRFFSAIPPPHDSSHTLCFSETEKPKPMVFPQNHSPKKPKEFQLFFITFTKGPSTYYVILKLNFLTPRPPPSVIFRHISLTPPPALILRHNLKFRQT